MKIIFILFVLFPFVSFAQVYSEVVEIPEKSAIQLYGDAIEWFVTEFSSDENMVLMEDPVSGKIIGRGAIDLSDSYGHKTKFKIRLLFKDGKSKIEIFNITISYGDDERPFSKIFEKKEYYQKASDWEWLVKNPTNGIAISKTDAKALAAENKKNSLLIDKTESAIMDLMSLFKIRMKKAEENW